MAGNESLPSTCSHFLEYYHSLNNPVCNNKDDLREYFRQFKAHNNTTFRFQSVLYYLRAKGVVTTGRDGSLRWRVNVVVDQRLAERTQQQHTNNYNNNNTANNTQQQQQQQPRSQRQVLFEENLSRFVAENVSMQEDKNGIVISYPQFPPLRKNLVETISIFVQNVGDQVRVLESCEPLKRSTYFGLSDSLRVSDGLGRAEILPGTTYTVRLTCRTEDFGLLQYSIFFIFTGFKILRHVNVSVSVPDDVKAILEPSSPYKRPPPVIKDVPALIVPGEKPDNVFIAFPVPLGQYKIPLALDRDAKHNIEGIKQLLDKPLTYATYKTHFHTLLWMEELQMNVDIRRYDTQSSMTYVPAGHILKVPGLSENRPSVLKGDRIYVSDPDAPVNNKKEYEGYVHMVGQEEVTLRFDRSFQERVYVKKKLYNIRFSFSRVPLRRMHQAIENAQFEAILFPKGTGFKAVENLPLNPINRSLNQQQLRAVKYITTISGEERKIPYIVFGPPGTGKSVTIVEAMLQIYTTCKKMNKRCSILACAPSNNAADLLVDRMAGIVENRDMLRLNAFSRNKQSVSAKALEHSLHVDGSFVLPTLDKLMQYRVVVSTCISAGMIPALGVPAGHFTHVFVDEAGQAAEPELLAALSMIINNNTTIVLSGDHKQLGPVIRSPIATKPVGGLNMSYLERLMQFAVYSRDVANYPQFGNYNPYYVTKLVNNYRSHPMILDMPSQLFYDSELVAMADIVRRTSMCGWEALPQSNFPIIFHGIEGTDEREGNSPSWFNSAEALTVLEYINKLREFRASPVTFADIGVISPYRKQVEKIRRLLQGRHMDAVKVGSVEEFQGQERRVIIISSVRSRQQDQIPFDLSHNLGFLKNPKRFNVSITRAQALLIIIGNPNILVKDPHWCAMLKYCIQHNSYVGCARPDSFTDDDEIDSVLAQFTRLRIGGDEDVDVPNVDNADPHWRDH